MGAAMVGLATGWRRFLGVLIALALCLLVFAPTASAGCMDDVAVAADRTAHQGSALVSADPSNADPSDAAPCEDGGCASIHCHCHPATAHEAAATADLAAPPGLHERHALAEAAAPASDLTFGLIRPPRA